MTDFYLSTQPLAATEKGQPVLLCLFSIENGD